MLYKQYLQTEHWKNKRLEKLATHPNCQICNSPKGIQVHHKRYKYDNQSILFNERVEDLITLCGSCHRLTHHYFGIDVHKINKKILRVKRLLELGAIKNKAFWVASQDNQLFISLVH
jgi:5-methylcytosine-specific restriction endonuclease McrA